jgi:nodulation protein F
MTEEILDAIAKYLDIPVAELPPERSLADFRIDSLDLAEMIYDIEDRFDVRIAKELTDLKHELQCVGDVCRLVDDLVRKKLVEKDAPAE